ncbi:hypothetical protein HPB52_006485 [Rhipicephalus sanguineus]|uniref:Tick transposon n=1 Tax=Rhipicephalus sanguineus TaxID=34632 RepID=A0A9D4PUV6_RHISA|nr:hypothetical protein HPB52_006485 [Rhipicephalus sanguineus]
MSSSMMARYLHRTFPSGLPFAAGPSGTIFGDVCREPLSIVLSSTFWRCTSLSASVIRSGASILRRLGFLSWSPLHLRLAQCSQTFRTRCGKERPFQRSLLIVAGNATRAALFSLQKREEGSDDRGQLPESRPPGPDLNHPSWISPTLPPFLAVLKPKTTPDLAVLRRLRRNISTCHHFGPTSPAHAFCRLTDPCDVVEDLGDAIASPHLSHPFDTLKAAIIPRKSESEHSKLQQLLTATELGDRHPSQLLRRMRQLLGGPSTPYGDELLRELFHQRLAQNMTRSLKCLLSGGLHTGPCLHAVTTPPLATAADPSLASIENRLDALVKSVDDFVPSHRRHSSKFQFHRSSSSHPRSSGLRPNDAPRDG